MTILYIWTVMRLPLVDRPSCPRSDREEVVSIIALQKLPNLHRTAYWWMGTTQTFGSQSWIEDYQECAPIQREGKKQQQTLELSKMMGPHILHQLQSKHCDESWLICILSMQNQESDISNNYGGIQRRWRKNLKITIVLNVKQLHHLLWTLDANLCQKLNRPLVNWV